MDAPDRPEPPTPEAPVPPPGTAAADDDWLAATAGTVDAALAAASALSDLAAAEARLSLFAARRTLLWSAVSLLAGFGTWLALAFALALAVAAWTGSAALGWSAVAVGHAVLVAVAVHARRYWRSQIGLAGTRAALQRALCPERRP